MDKLALFSDIWPGRRCVLLRPAREPMSGALTSRERVEARCRQVAKRGYGFNFSVFVDPHLNEATKWDKGVHLGVTDWMLQFVTQRGLLVLQSEDTVANRLLIKDHRLVGFLSVLL